MASCARRCWPTSPGRDAAVLHERAATALAAAVRRPSRWPSSGSRPAAPDQAGPALAAAAREVARDVRRRGTPWPRRSAPWRPERPIRRWSASCWSWPAGARSSAASSRPPRDAWRAVARARRGRRPAPASGAAAPGRGAGAARRVAARAGGASRRRGRTSSASDDPAQRRASGCACVAAARAAACWSRRWRSWSGRAPRRSRAATLRRWRGRSGSRGRSAASSASTSAGCALVRQALALALEHDGPRRGRETYTSSRSCWPTARTTAAPPTRTARRTRCAGSAASRARATSAWRASATCCARAATGTHAARSVPRCRRTHRRTPCITAEINVAGVRILRGETRAGRPVAERFVALCRAGTCRSARSRAAGSSRSPTRPTAGRTPRRRSAGRCSRGSPTRTTATTSCPSCAGRRRSWASAAPRTRVRPVRRGALRAGGRVAPQEALGALAHVLGEVALLEGDATAAAEQFEAGLARARPPGGALGSRADRAASGRRSRGGG